MTTQHAQTNGRGTGANTEPPHRPRARIPRSRRISLPHTRMQVSVHPDGSAHPDSISRASGTTSRRALDAPAKTRIKI